MFRFFCLIIGYLLGMIQTAYIVGRFHNIDIREYGSGNAGSTNVMRVLGKKAAFITFIFDVLKGVFAVFICKLLFKEDAEIAGIYGGFGSVLGHDFPFYLKFRGGKGLAATLGVILATNYILLLYVIPIAVLVLLSGYVSMTALAIFIWSVISAIILKLNNEVIMLLVAMSVLGITQHRANIKRLLEGSESRMFNLFKRKD